MDEGQSAYYHLLFWDDEEVDYLVGTKAYDVAWTVRQDARASYIKLVQSLFAEYPSTFSLFDYTLRVYQWALGNILISYVNIL